MSGAANLETVETLTARTLSNAKAARGYALGWARDGARSYRRGLRAGTRSLSVQYFFDAFYCFKRAEIERELARALTEIAETHRGAVLLVRHGFTRLDSRIA